MSQYRLIKYDGNMYRIKRIIPESAFKVEYEPEDLKAWTDSDIILRRDGKIYCCELIPEAEIID